MTKDEIGGRSVNITKENDKIKVVFHQSMHELTFLDQESVP